MSANSDVISLRLEEIVTRHLLLAREPWLPLKVGVWERSDAKRLWVTAWLLLQRRPALLADREPRVFHMSPSPPVWFQFWELVLRAGTQAQIVPVNGPSGRSRVE